MDGALPATKNVTYSVVVKKCIISALKHDLPTVVRDDETLGKGTGKSSAL